MTRVYPEIDYFWSRIYEEDDLDSQILQETCARKTRRDHEDQELAGP